jgi:hypothetical protein
MQIFLVDFSFNVPKFPFKLITPSYFIYKLALKGVHICIQLQLEYFDFNTAIN